MGKLSSLFVIYGAGPPKFLTAQTIAHWIVDAIKATLITATVCPVRAHSTWGSSTSEALLRGVSIKNIIRATDWASASVFGNLYLKEHCRREGNFASVLRLARL